MMDLCTDIFDHILEYLDDPTIYEFRQTSHMIFDHVFDYNKKRYAKSQCNFHEIGSLINFAIMNDYYNLFKYYLTLGIKPTIITNVGTNLHMIIDIIENQFTVSNDAFKYAISHHKNAVLILTLLQSYIGKRNIFYLQSQVYPIDVCKHGSVDVFRWYMDQLPICNDNLNYIWDDIIMCNRLDILRFCYDHMYCDGFELHLINIANEYNQRDIINYLSTKTIQKKYNT